MNKKISVLIANYNNQKYIHECIKSLTDQTYDNLEIIVFDDCSSDESILEINKFKKAGMEFFEEFDKLEHIGSMFTVRTVLSYRDYDDARPTLVRKEGDNIFSIFSGKIGTCVTASTQLVDMIKDIKYV